MKSFQYTIQDEVGLHARPAGLLVKMAKKYESKILVCKGEKEVDATKLMAVISMGVNRGTEVTVKIEGTDEEKAVEDLEKFFKENL